MILQNVSAKATQLFYHLIMSERCEAAGRMVFKETGRCEWNRIVELFVQSPHKINSCNIQRNIV